MRAEDRYDSLFQFYAGEFRLDWLLLKSQVKAESSFDPNARSFRGAMGLAQFMGPTFNEWADVLKIHLPNPYKAEDSIACQAAYMRWLTDKLDSTEKALAAYKWGVGNLEKAIADLGLRNADFPDGEWRESLPRETREYIGKVRHYYEQYERERMKDKG